MPFSIEKNILVKYTDDGSADVVIPEGVRAIGREVFRACRNIATVTIPEGVTGIYEKAFFRCSSLTSVSFPSSMSYIAPDAFDGTPWLKAQTDELVVVNGIAFRNNRPGKENVTVPDSVTIIGDHLFDGCGTLTAVKLPETVTDIGRFAFSGCKKLRSINIPRSIKYIGYFAFEGCDSLGKLDIPDGVQEDSSWFYQTEG